MKFPLLKCTLWCTVWPLHVCAAEPSSWQLQPAAMATGVAIDTTLSITFSVAPRLGRDGAVKIFRAADHVLVDQLHPGESLDSIGPARQEYHRLVRYTAFKMDGAMLTIRPHNARLDYDTEYQVVIDPGLLDGAKLPSWTFRTRAARRHHAEGGR